jgi:hypothetical protein
MAVTGSCSCIMNEEEDDSLLGWSRGWSRWARKWASLPGLVGLAFLLYFLFSGKRLDFINAKSFLIFFIKTICLP